MIDIDKFLANLQKLRRVHLDLEARNKDQNLKNSGSISLIPQSRLHAMKE